MHREYALYPCRLKEPKLGKPALKESPMIIGMLASTRGMKLAVLDLVRLLAAKKSLEIIAATLAQIPVARQGIYLLVYKSIAGSRF
jgi:hypothetical protein